MSNLSLLSPISFNSESGAQTQTPHCLNWSRDEVGEWITSIGFERYSPCFIENNIGGKKLILINASTLPSIGVQDFEHILIISKMIRELLGVETPNWRRSLCLPPQSEIGTFLSQKSRSGVTPDKLIFCHSTLEDI
ncbi:hypothetical protein LOD99_7895 [Oopsacas minuta]|uniref:SAM domain-containing protein n=1 Tax=Oopsacas minuta TaxID=111878 RepID=A0AAV7JIZ6_9METZ|nr:hypothetical protein LOD99_7895 [Oopsacas minuta]